MRKSSAGYIQRGDIDAEDLENGTIVKESWRKNVGNPEGLRDLKSTADFRNYSKKAAEVRNNVL